MFVSHFSFKCLSDYLFFIEVCATQDFAFSLNLDLVQSQIVIDHKHLVILVLPLSLNLIFLLGCLDVVVVEWVELKGKDGSDEGCSKLSSLVLKLLIDHTDCDLINGVTLGAIVTASVVKVIIDSSLHLEIYLKLRSFAYFVIIKFLFLLLVII